MIKYKKISKKFKIPTIGYGTGKLVCDNSYTKNILLNRNKYKKNIFLIKKGINNGIIHLDTAPNYSCGLSEKIIGEAIKRIKREKIFITSKIGKDYLDRKNVFLTVKKSLKRMGLKYLDLCLIHWPNPNISLKETINALLDLKRMGLIKNIGVSNFNIKLLKKAQYYSGNQIVANQIRYNILYRDTIDTVKYCQENNIIVIAYRPFEGGYLFNKYFFLLSLMDKKLSVLAIHWLIKQKNVVCIAKAKNSDSLKEIIYAKNNKMNFSLKDKIILNYLFPLEVWLRGLRKEYINWNFHYTNHINEI